MLKKALIFVSVVENGSFTAAARKLNVAQPWLSIQIKQLEEMLGFDLLVRNNRFVELTPEGRKLLPICQRIDEHYRNFKSRSETLDRRKQGNLTIGCETSAIHDSIRYTFINHFMHAHPDIDIRVSSEAFRHIFQDLSDQRVDIIYAPLPVADPRIDTVVMSRHEIVLLLPATHRLAGAERIKTVDIAGVEILTGNPAFATSCNSGQMDIFSRIDWMEPPETEYESRYHMVRMLDRPSLWINYPGQLHALPAGLCIRHFEEPMHCNFGFAKLQGNEEGALSRFLSLAAKFATLKTARLSPATTGQV